MVDSVVGHEPRQRSLLRLTDTVHAAEGLMLNALIEPQVDNDDALRSREIQTSATGLKRPNHDRDRCIGVKGGFGVVAFVLCHLAVICAVFPTIFKAGPGDDTDEEMELSKDDQFCVRLFNKSLLDLPDDGLRFGRVEDILFVQQAPIQVVHVRPAWTVKLNFVLDRLIPIFHPELRLEVRVIDCRVFGAVVRLVASDAFDPRILVRAVSGMIRGKLGETLGAVDAQALRQVGAIRQLSTDLTAHFTSGAFVLVVLAETYGCHYGCHSSVRIHKP